MSFVIWEALSLILFRILLAIFGLSFYRFVFTLLRYSIEKCSILSLRICIENINEKIFHLDCLG